LTSFKKNRPTLSNEIKKIYKEQYKENREGASTASSLAQKMEAWMHKQIASDLNNGEDKSTLEIGAGTLNQLMYELNNKEYDIIEPFGELYADSPQLNRIRNTCRAYPKFLQILNISESHPLQHWNISATCQKWWPSQDYC
jgi:hypothetical protein